MNISSRSHFLLIVGALLVTACDGGGISVDITGPSFKTVGNISEPVASIGIATRNGGISVNGVRYETAAATVLINGRPATMAAIETGHYVQLDGRIQGLGLSGTATLVNVDANIVGPIGSIDVSASTLTVMGQPVRVGTSTIFGPGFDPGDLDRLRLRARIAVSGYAAGDGSLEATRIDVAPAGASDQLVGRVFDSDTGNRTFRIGDLVVNYSNARIVELPGGLPQNGGVVLVRGTLANGILQSDELLGVYGSGTREVRRRAYLEGLVTRFVDANEFEVGAYRVSTTAVTSFQNGTRAELGSNAQIRVYGRVGADGVTIVADRITYLTLVDHLT